MQNELVIVIILVIGWSRRLVVRTPGFHPGNRGFDSHRDHHFLLLVFLFGDIFWGYFRGFWDIVFILIVDGNIRYAVFCIVGRQILRLRLGLPITGEIC